MSIQTEEQSQTVSYETFQDWNHVQIVQYAKVLIGQTPKPLVEAKHPVEVENNGFQLLTSTGGKINLGREWSNSHTASLNNSKLGIKNRYRFTWYVHVSIPKSNRELCNSYLLTGLLKIQFVSYNYILWMSPVYIEYTYKQRKETEI